MHGAPADARYTTGLEDIREHACVCVCVCVRACVRACHVMSACDRLTGHYTAHGREGILWRSWQLKRRLAAAFLASFGRVGGPNGHQQEPCRIPWATLAAKMARRHSKRPIGGERQRAPNVTHSVVLETRAPEVMEIVIYFERRAKTRKVVPDQGAPNATHSVISGT